MSTYKIVEQKLKRFIQKYYWNDLIKGAILFFALGVLYFLLILVIEYFLWLSTEGRAVLFWLFVVVELILLYRYLVIPILRLLKLKEGINFFDAGAIIGAHFPEVSDKLINTLQLYKNAGTNELQLASVAQKSNELEPIPFKLAIDFKHNLKYLKYALIPLLILLMGNFINSGMFTQSYERVVNYSEVYVPPAPFSFEIQNEKLSVIQDEPFDLVINVKGLVLPEQVYIVYNGETLPLKNISNSSFTYHFEGLQKSFEFVLTANEVISQEYALEVLASPKLTAVEMYLQYPRHTLKQNETVYNSGNALVPEGTKISWKVNTSNTSSVDFIVQDSSYVMQPSRDDAIFNHSKVARKTFNYTISSNNKYLQAYERLDYAVKVLKDQFPTISLDVKKDTLVKDQFHYSGTVSDDYGIRSVELVYGIVGDSNLITENITFSKGSVSTFFDTFPGNRKLQEGKSYEYFYQVTDNDRFNNFKSVKSPIYIFNKKTQLQETKENLQEQGNSIGGLSKTVDKFDQQRKELDAVIRARKESKSEDFNAKRKLKSLLNKFKQNAKESQKFTDKLKKSLQQDKANSPAIDKDKELLKERLEREALQAKKNEELLKELQRIKDKISKEELTERLEKLQKSNSKSKRNLQQLVELTKRYYVEKRAEQISNELRQLAKKLEELANSNTDSKKDQQDAINKQFEQLKQSLKDLQKENKALKSPMQIPGDQKAEDEISDALKNAFEELSKKEQSSESQKESHDAKAKKNQKKAATKMQQMAGNMSQSMKGGKSIEMEEDADRIRHILDNLLDFGFSEEELMNNTKYLDVKSPNFARNLRDQNFLYQNFKHVDDSLFVMSLRIPELGEKINESLIDVTYNLNKTLQLLADNKVSRGVSAQQYVITGTNELSDLLSGTLSNMQQQMKGQGQGQGEGQGMQLPDMIKSQEELSKMSKQGEGKSQKEGGDSSGKSGENGKEPGGEGNSSSPGDQGDPSNGKGSKPGQEGSDGKEEGGEGQSGQGQGQGGEGQGQGNQGNGQQGSQGQGSNQNGTSGNANGGSNGSGSETSTPNTKTSDEEDAFIYEILKQQEQLRNQLEDRISNEFTDAQKQSIINEMKEVEDEILDNGISSETSKRMDKIKHQLIKLNESSHKQGQDKKRQSTTSKRQFSNSNQNSIFNAKDYFKEVEILNRKPLPLDQNIQLKVNQYFNSND